MANKYLLALGIEPRPKKPKAVPKAKRANISPSHQRAKNQEREVAGRFARLLTPASGARDVKGDVRVSGVLRLECKTTKNKSFSVTLDMIRKIEEAALSTGEMPAILVEFNDGAGNKICEVAVVPSYVLDGLIK